MRTITRRYIDNHLSYCQPVIRELRQEDKPAVIELVRATKNFSDAEILIAEELIDIVTTNSEQRDYYAYVAEAEDNGISRVAGFLLLGPTPATTGTYDMYWIAVHPGFYGRGIAQMLDECAMTFVKQRDGYWLIAETSSQPSYERTRAFYNKQKYQQLACIPDYYKPGDDLIIFGKRV